MKPPDACKCTQCGSPMGRRPHHWRGSVAALVAAAAFLLPMGQAFAFEIDRASWRSNLDRLWVRGDKAPDNATVTIRHGKIEDKGER